MPEDSASLSANSPASLLRGRPVLAAFFLLGVRAVAAGKSGRLLPISSAARDAWRKFPRTGGLCELSQREEPLAIPHGDGTCPECGRRERRARNPSADDLSSREVLL